jgi:hypothetical protein
MAAFIFPRIWKCITWGKSCILAGMAQGVFNVLAAFGWVVVGVFGIVLVAAAVFILGFLLSMVVAVIHGSGVGVEHLVERGLHHGSGHTGRLAVHS